MKDDPETFLGVRPSPPAAEKDSGQWLWALLAPVMGFVPGLAIGLSARPNQNDWLGLSVLLPASVGLALGGIISIVFSALSIHRQEKLCVVSLIASFPCAVGIVWIIGMLLRHRLVDH